MSMAARFPDVNSPFGTYRAGGRARLAWALADRHELSPRWRKRLRAFVARHYRGPYDREAEGLRFRLYPGANYDDRKIMARGRLPERDEHGLLSDCLRPGAVFVDIGANVGSYSLDAARRGARVLAIEADSETAAKLAFNLAANSLGDVEVENVAVGARDEVLDLWSEPSNCGFATLVSDLTTGEWAGDWKSRPVQVRPLADILVDHRIARVDVLKIDVEGFEDRALLPYVNRLEDDDLPGAILLETNCRDHWQHDCIAELQARGYRAAGATKDNTIFRRGA
ncbi:FkbM family methyltransferase [Stappia sp. ES.058]|uniref:FkbM family methyltransferase n=1 Tax=Stappia sp. ES.058 TaxID=1881061 RepID=UPI00087A45AD|nr:FkbM family methyltransferase [Stappia sp. ES.058]SDU46924.1 methyltransferase, FkbM family [Stappia sp. ES.058]